MPRNESKHDRFKRIATNRVRTIIRDYERIGKLAGSGYQYTDEEVDKIFNTLQEKLAYVKTQFTIKRQEDTKFEL